MNEALTLALLIIVCLTVALFAAIFLAKYINEFSAELKYLNMEIARSDGREKEFWKRKKLKLCLSLLPFIKY